LVHFLLASSSLLRQSHLKGETQNGTLQTALETEPLVLDIPLTESASLQLGTAPCFLASLIIAEQLSWKCNRWLVYETTFDCEDNSTVLPSSVHYDHA